MGRSCTVCADPRRDAVDTALAAGESIRAIAGRFKMPRSNLARHAPHVAATVRAAQQAADDARVLDIAKLLGAINSAALDMLRQARTDGDGRLGLLACNVILRQLEFSHSLDVEAQQAELWRRVEALEQITARANGKDQWSPSGIV